MRQEAPLRYLHTMVRVTNIEQSLDFYCNKLGMQEVRRAESEAGRYTLIFLAAPQDKGRAAAERGAPPGAHLSTGIRRNTVRAAISAIWPSRSTTSMPPATAS